MLRSNIHKINEDLRKLNHDVEELLRATSRSDGETATGARARMEESVRAIRERLAAAQREIGGYARSADGYVHESPWEVVGIVAGVPVLLRLLVEGNSSPTAGQRWTYDRY